AVFSFQITKSRAASLLSTVLILLNGGFGWTMLAGDVKKTEGGLLDLLMHLPHDYTVISDTTWRWGNTITSLLVTQRSILMGMPLTIIVFIELWKMTAGRQSEERPAEPATPSRGPKTKNKKAVIKRLHGTNEHHRMLGAGAVAGLLPLIHVHSFLVAMTVAGCLCLIFRSWGKWAAFFAATLVLALPQIGWLYAAAPTHFGGFFSFELGWDHSKDNAIWFWFKNTGLFIPLLLLAFVWKSGGREMISKKLLLFYAPFALCFIVPNMFKFAPWIWDNIKILIYWYIGSCPLVAMLLLQFWRRGRFARAATIFMIFIMVLAGFLDNFRIASGASEFLELDDNQVRMADFIEQATPPNALVLHTATHNNPLVLTGRRSLMGYPGHVWSHGIDIGHREDDIRQIYAGSPAAAALIAQYGIDYAIVGSQERDAMDVNDAFFRQFPDVGGVGDIRLYKLR
ncbi:MAG TPA: hypothetical protein VLZ81_08680, partial [Blastocatellia bacterium]|nr:hypothetical protein [Blastocatellia bacterium]